jgi:hypothetical protein
MAAVHSKETAMQTAEPVGAGAPRILMYIEHESTAERLATLLSANGIEAHLAYSDKAFDELAVSGVFDAVIVRTALIGKICLKVSLPIINIDRFVYSVIDHDPEVPGSKLLDGEKFVTEVFDLKHMASAGLAPRNSRLPIKSALAA